MRLFFSAGEPSGDLHGANLIRALCAQQPDIECVGYGGERMQEAGCRLNFPLCSMAVMGFLPVLLNAYKFVSLLRQADQSFRENPPDAVVLIDYPGFNWGIAKRAHAQGIPVYYFVPPQIWGWAQWRVHKMRRWVDHVLCSLPFEEAWYAGHGIDAHHFGHPYFDELPRQNLDSAFMEEHANQPGKLIGLLPGSRTQEVEQNLKTLMRSARLIRVARPDTRFLVACFKPSHAKLVEQYARAHELSFVQTVVGRTPEVIELAHSCIAVSGSVSLEMLYRGKPAVIVYHMKPLYVPIVRVMQKVPYISLVNLIANEEVYPEFLSTKCESEQVANHVIRWLNDPKSHGVVKGQLQRLRDCVGLPGACDRAAAYIVSGLKLPLRASA